MSAIPVGTNSVKRWGWSDIWVGWKEGGIMVEVISRQTGQSNKTTWVFQVPWKGQQLWLHATDEPPCHILRGKPCEPEVMHHLGEKGEHYCPTELIYCPICMAIGDEPEPHECQRWGE
jgi:hypothetical protein